LPITLLEDELWEGGGMIPFTRKQRKMRVLDKKFEKWNGIYAKAWDVMRIASRQKQRILKQMAELNEGSCEKVSS